MPSLVSRLPLRIDVLDHAGPACRELYRTLLGDSRLEVVGRKDTLRELPGLVQRTAADVVVVGASRSEGEKCSDTALDAVARAAMLEPSTPILALVEEGMVEAAGHLVLAGARGVLTQDVSDDEFFAAACAALAGGCPIDPLLTCGIFERLSRTVPAGAFEAPRAGQEPSPASPPQPDEQAAWHNLTGREADVLSGLAEGLSNKEIATSLGVGIGTVKMYVKRIFLKLGVDNRAAAPLVAAGKLDLAARLERQSQA